MQQHNLKKMQAVLSSLCGLQSNRALVERIAEDKKLRVPSSLMNESIAIVALPILHCFFAVAIITHLEGILVDVALVLQLRGT